LVDQDVSLVELFGLQFHAVTVDLAARLILQAAGEKRKVLVITPNVDHVIHIQNDEKIRKIYQKADFILADGMPLVWLSRCLPGRLPLPERINGTELMLRVSALAAKQGQSIALAGGKTGAAELAGRTLVKQFPGLRVVGTCCPPFGFESDVTETGSILQFLEDNQPDILFLGVGAPKQEIWAAEHFDQLAAGAILCVGSSIEISAGLIRRAPLWIRQAGFEWLWRLLMEPGRLWKRYLVDDMAFFPLAVREWRLAQKQAMSGNNNSDNSKV
jgi:N-acetylglucosaminyldiphosphoundecaprenol N-acetyl-beta-D-mannosaminyltransferase